MFSIFILIIINLFRNLKKSVKKKYKLYDLEFKNKKVMVKGLEPKIKEFFSNEEDENNLYK